MGSTTRGFTVVIIRRQEPANLFVTDFIKTLWTMGVFLPTNGITSRKLGSVSKEMNPGRFGPGPDGRVISA